MAKYGVDSFFVACRKREFSLTYTTETEMSNGKKKENLLHLFTYLFTYKLNLFA